MQLKRVVVTGLGAFTPIGNNLNDYWNALINGVSGAGPITRFDPEKFKTKFACEVKNYDPLDHFDRKEVRKMDAFTQYAMITSKEAVEHSGLNLDKINKLKAGVIWGSGIGGLKTFQEEVKGFAGGDGTPRFNPFYTKNDIGHLCRYDFHEIWFPWTKFRNSFCLCIGYKCCDRCYDLH